MNLLLIQTGFLRLIFEFLQLLIQPDTLGRRRTINLPLQT